MFETTIATSDPGIYHFHLRASGATLRGVPFTREQLLTGAVWKGGDQPRQTPPSSDGPEHDEKLCRLINCLLHQDSIRRLLENHDVNVEEIGRCVAKYCGEE